MSDPIKYAKLYVRAFLPMAPVLLAYIIWMPATGSPAFWELALHQQLIASTALPATLWSLWRFVGYVNEEKDTPEERILQGDE